MKFMELDEAGFIHHIMDDPCITMVPVINRIKGKLDDNGTVVSPRGHRMLGVNPQEHAKQLLPRTISDVHWQLIMDAGGVAGIDNPSDTTTHWQWKWDENKQEPAKCYYNKTSSLPERKFPDDVPAAGTKPCKGCPEGKS